MNAVEAIESMQQGNRLRAVSIDYPTGDPFDRQYYQILADGRVYCFQVETSCAAKLIWSWTTEEFICFTNLQYRMWEQSLEPV